MPCGCLSSPPRETTVIAPVAGFSSTIWGVLPPSAISSVPFGAAAMPASGVLPKLRTSVCSPVTVSTPITYDPPATGDEEAAVVYSVSPETAP